MLKLASIVAATALLTVVQDAAGQGAWLQAISEAEPDSSQRAAAVPPVDLTTWRAYLLGGACLYETPAEVILAGGAASRMSGILRLPPSDDGRTMKQNAPRLVPPIEEDTIHATVLETRCSSRPAGEIISMLLDVRGSLVAFEGPGYGPLRVETDSGGLEALRYHREGEITVAESAIAGILAAQAAAEAEAAEAERRRRIADYRSRGWSQRAVDAIMARRIYVGMTPEMVIESWGRPEDVNRTITAAGTSEQWVYGLGSYVYFDNGVLTAIQN